MLNSLNLKKIRCERELSISQLSYKCGVARGYLYELENNTYDNPSLKIICKLCKGLKISPNELINQELWK